MRDCIFFLDKVGLCPFTGTWTQNDVGASDDSVRTVALGDLDGDGDLDIVSGGWDNAVKVWQNDGTPFDTGVPWASQTVGSPTPNVETLAVGDLDGDGDLDLWVAGNPNQVWLNTLK